MSGVAISGKAGAGKNAFARILGREMVRRGLWAYELAFGDALKELVLKRTGLTKEMPGGRAALVEIGDATRSDDPDVWVKALAARVDSLRPYGLLPVVTDVRRVNEYEWCRSSGLVMVRIDASVLDRSLALVDRGEDVSFVISEHDTETEVDESEYAVRFWNPHGDMGNAMRHAAAVVADLVCGATVVTT